MTDVAVSSCEGIEIGAAVTLSQLEQVLKAKVQQRPTHETRIFKAIVKMLEWFAGKQIRNVAALGGTHVVFIYCLHYPTETSAPVSGNIMTGSPISDMNQILMAAGCKLTFHQYPDKIREVTMDDDFFTGYRQNVARPQEVLVSIWLPITSPQEYFVAFKQARRRDDDIAIVNSAFLFEVDNADGSIKTARMAFGGMAQTTIMAPKTMALMTGAKWTQETIEAACESLLDELPLAPGAPGAMVRYRRSLTISFLFKAFLAISQESGLATMPSQWLSGQDVFHKDDIQSHQFFEIKNDPNLTPVGQPLKHKSADKQATGEAVYVDDMPAFENELYAGLVLSSKAHAQILKIDPSMALQMDGVMDFVSAKDIHEDRNSFSIAIVYDEKVFYDDKVTAIGQCLGLVLASDPDIARKAAKLVEVKYSPLPAIVTVEEAIAAKSFHTWESHPVCKGDPINELKKADHVLQGEVRNGAQEHFYMETQACIVVPMKEDGEMLVYSSTQSPSETQLVVADVLGIDMNKITCKVKRMGGGFGGKEYRCHPLTTACAVAANKTMRPVRIMLDRDEDMLFSGHRHPFLSRYTVGFDKDGRIKALEVDLYANGGCTMDISFAVVERGMFHVQNAYKIDDILVRGHVCKTNLPSNTAFRGFGAPQAMIVIENIVDRVIFDELKQFFFTILGC